MAGTLEGIGPNEKGDTSAPIRNLGFTSYSDNAATSPSTTIPGQRNNVATPCETTVLARNTKPVAVTGGTLTPGGSGEKWR